MQRVVGGSRRRGRRNDRLLLAGTCRALPWKALMLTVPAAFCGALQPVETQEPRTARKNAAGVFRGRIGRKATPARRGRQRCAAFLHESHPFGAGQEGRHALRPDAEGASIIGDLNERLFGVVNQLAFLARLALPGAQAGILSNFEADSGLVSCDFDLPAGSRCITSPQSARGGDRGAGAEWRAGRRRSAIGGGDYLGNH